jgi:hypothetical protein
LISHPGARGPAGRGNVFFTGKYRVQNNSQGFFLPGLNKPAAPTFFNEFTATGIGSGDNAPSSGHGFEHNIWPSFPQTWQHKKMMITHQINDLLGGNTAKKTDSFRNAQTFGKGAKGVTLLPLAGNSQLPVAPG